MPNGSAPAPGERQRQPPPDRQQPPARQRREPIAVVGAGLRFPGDNTTLDGFAAFLRAGRSGITPVPEGRWDAAAFTPSEPGEQGKIHTAGGGFLRRIDEFDAPFFNISPKEARFVDPQQRLLLETAWEALESANISPAPLRGGNGGVYVGASSVDYALESNDLGYAELDGHLAAGTTIFPLSGRLSYFLGWRGPCLSVDTACSSALSALHLAVTGLRGGECDIALCAGVNAIHHPRVMVTFSHAGMLAPDGQCKTFDEAADGYVRAEGCGVLVLKRLSDAARDGDTVLALVTGTAVGQDGDSAGLTVPNGIAQEATMRSALASAALEPGDVSYVEAHGTGTALGDPIEMGAISDVFGASHSKDAPLVVASVKTNLGHMEPASGIVAVIKIIAQLRDGLIYPHLNFTTPSGRIPWDSYPVTVPTQCVPWQAPARRAVVNSFGFAGTIAAAVLEEAPAAPRPQPAPPDGGGEVYTVSARNTRALRRQLEQHQRFLAGHPDADVRDLCYTTNVGRSHFPVRAAGVAAGHAELGKLLARHIGQLSEGGRSRRASRGPRKAGFLFSGQGSQYPGMGAAAYRQYPLFRQLTDECDRLFAGHLGASVKDVMLGGAGDPGALDQTLFTQPALFTLEYALARLWMSWGVRPSTMIGHSIGEVAAAAVAGVFSLEDAVVLVATRARLMQSVREPGGMAAVGLGADEVAPLLAGFPGLAVAAINSPRQCVLSGGLTALDGAEAVLRERGANVTRLAVSHAFHSPLMHEVAGEFRAALAGIRFRPPQLSLISNVTGELARASDLCDPGYWVSHIGEPVNFEGGMRALARRGGHVLIEIGPSSALTSLGRQCPDAGSHTWLTSMSRRDTSGRALRDAVAAVYTAGLPVSWEGFHHGRAGRKIALPSYAFERKPYWLPNQASRHGLGTRAAAEHPLLGREVPAVSPPSTDPPNTDLLSNGQSGNQPPANGQPGPGVREFAASLSPAHPAYLADHVIGGQVALPASACLEMLWALQDAVYGGRPFAIEDLRLAEPLVLVDGEPVEVRTRLTEGRSTEIAAIVDGTRRCLATAVFAEVGDTGWPGTDGAGGDWAGVGAGGAGPGDFASTGAALEVRPEAGIYAALAGLGLDFGPRFRRLSQLTILATPDSWGRWLAVGELRNRPASPAEQAQPEVVAGALHAAAALAGEAGGLVPSHIRGARLLRKPRAAELRVLVSVSPLDAAAPAGPGTATPAPPATAVPAGAGPAAPAEPGVVALADIAVCEGDQLILELRGVALTRPAPAARQQLEFLHEQRWVAAPRAEPAAPRERHLAIVHRPEASLPGLATAAGRAGVRLSFADGPEQAAELVRTAAVTDVWWFWRGGTPGSAGGTTPGGAPGAMPGGVPGGVPGGAAGLREECERNYRDLLALVELLSKAGFGRRQRLWLVTERAQHVVGDEDPAMAGLAAATVWGFGHVLLNEYPTFRATLADTDGDVVPLLDELLARETGEFQLAFRGGSRLVRRVVPSEHTGSGEPVLRPDRTYLVTGGLGALGLLAAGKLAALGARHLALVGRRGVPADDVAHLLAEVRRQAEVTVWPADIASPGEAGRIIGEIAAGGRPVAGIVHTAGVLADGPVSTQTWESIDTVFQAKVYGSWLLHEATGAMPDLDFFVGFSSAAAALGGVTQSNYAAANAFLDDLMRRRRGHGMPGLSINWGPWSEVGMSARLSPAIRKAWDDQGIKFFSPATGMRAMASLLTAPVAQVGAGECDWSLFVPAKPVANALYDQVFKPAPGSLRADPDLLTSLEQADRQAAIEELILARLGAVLHAEDTDAFTPDAEFVQLGLDSLMAMELRTALEGTFALPLPASIAFDYPCAELLAEFIGRQLEPEPRELTR